MKYTDKLNLRKPEGGEYYSVEDFNGNADLIDTAITGKINKPAEYTTGNITAFSASGNIEDSGRKPSDFATAEHNHDTTYASIAHMTDATIHVDADEKATIATVDSKADKNYVDSALANKANTTYGIVPDNNLLIWADKQIEAGGFYVDGSKTPDGTPVKGGHYHGELLMSVGDGKTLVLRMTGGRMWTLSRDSFGWYGNGKWTEYAPVTPLQWHDLPLAETFVSASDQPAQYAKDCFGFLHLRGFIFFDVNASVPPNVVFASLPFSILHSIRTPVTVDVTIPTNYSDPAVLIITKEGDMRLGTSRYYSFLGGALSLQGVSFYVG